MIALVTGGARSGKSAFAERYAAHLAEEGVYIATSEALDEEMQERIGKHRKRRELQTAIRWMTVEKPLRLASELRRWREDPEVQAGRRVILIDCLTLWLSNMMMTMTPDRIEEGIGELVRELERFGGHAILVTNEVGDGIVPAAPLGRKYRDLAGWMNQRVAAVCDQVFLVTAGIPVELKSLAFRFPDPRPERH